MRTQSIKARVLTVVVGVMLTVTAVMPIAAFAADTDTVYITNTGAKYHRQDCKTLVGKTSWAVTKAQAKGQGLSTCHVCWPDLDDTVATTVTTTTTVQSTVAATPQPTAATATSTTITPAEAVQQAYAMYVQNGLDSNTAFARTQAITAQLCTQPGNVAQIVQNDLAGVLGQTATVATGLTAQDAVQKAFALYVQNGLDTNTAFARVQGITAQLCAQPDAYAQIVQADLQ